MQIRLPRRPTTLLAVLVAVVAPSLAAPTRAIAQAAPRPGVLVPTRPTPPPKQPLPGTSAPAPTTPAASAFRPDTAKPMAVYGVVFDSLANAPLANAQVQFVSEIDRTKSFAATTDSLGRYRVPNLVPGRYLAGYFHEMIDALGIEPQVMRVMVNPDTAARLDFGVPGPRRVRAALCGAQPGDTTGALIGVVRDAESGVPVPNAKVVVTWQEVQFDATGLRNAHRRFPARVRPGGAYAICGLPADGSVEANAEAPGRLGGIIQVNVPPRAVLRRDFFLGDSVTAVATQLPDTMAAIEKRPANPITVTRGSARLTGTVRARDGRALPGARLQIWGSGISGQTTENGAYSMTGLPAGTYSLEVRAIGYEPRRVAIDLSAKRPNVADVVLDKQVATLSSVVVRGARTKSEQDFNGFLQRKSQGFGKFFTQEDIETRQPFVMSDLMRTTPGMQVSPNGSFGYVIRGRGGCTPEVFIDGMKVMQGADEVDNLVRPNEVEGVEVYTGQAGVPPQYGGMAGGDCGVVLIWTKRGGPTKPSGKKP